MDHVETTEPEYDLSSSEDLGQITINNDVVARISALAASKVPGVSLGGRFNLGDFIAGRKEPARGVAVEITSSRATIRLAVKVDYGQNMYDLAHRLQRTVKDAVEQMTGLSVERVDVAIVDIVTETDRRDRSDKREDK